MLTHNAPNPPLPGRAQDQRRPARCVGGRRQQVGGPRRRRGAAAVGVPRVCARVSAEVTCYYTTWQSPGPQAQPPHFAGPRKNPIDQARACQPHAAHAAARAHLPPRTVAVRTGARALRPGAASQQSSPVDARCLPCLPPYVPRPYSTGTGTTHATLKRPKRAWLAATASRHPPASPLPLASRKVTYTPLRPLCPWKTRPQAHRISISYPNLRRAPPQSTAAKPPVGAAGHSFPVRACVRFQSARAAASRHCWLLLPVTCCSLLPPLAYVRFATCTRAASRHCCCSLSQPVRIRP